ncbi:transmembrane amino acid transporter protein-domain-containing protein [Dipodascopsis uninucleata]
MSEASSTLLSNLVRHNAAVVEYVEDEEDDDYNVLNHLREEDDDDEDGHLRHVGNAGISSSIANLSNTILGAGILAMPFAFKANGVFLGLFVIVMSGFTSGLGLYLQYRCSRYLARGGASFFALSQLTYPSLSSLFDAAIAVKCFGVGVSYLIIIGDLMPQVIHDFLPSVTEESFLESRHFWISLFMFVLVPLCFLRKLDSLKYTSIVALLAIGYLSILVVAHWFIGDTIDYRGSLSMYPSSLSGVLSTLPIVVFGFTCHQNMFSIVNELSDNRHGSVFFIIFSSIGSAIFLYTLVGITGYLSFGDNAAGNIIGMYPSSFTSAVGRAAIVVLVLFSYPLQCHPCRASLDHILSHYLDTSMSRSIRGKSTQISGTRFIILTTIIIVLSYFVAMTISSLETVLAFIGATGSTSISFILPGIFGYKLLGSPDHLPVPEAKTTTDSDPEVQFPPDSVVLVSPEDEDEVDDIPDGVPGEGIYVDEYGQRHLRNLHGEGAFIKYTSLALACWGVFILVVCLGTNIWLLGQK